eukprot:CAMPEP_0113893016 /NCGR_PEP_ID=MMETSP0780_2-20120614/15799_1 /TAXON_ID=652834 /ORGANISM="Palpitomonas bilix" /LENGTH=592 /DNA_ID=CAMNT_0000883141 /DNA_START=187 /DNA_END=1961 /DNA_ORIENTATION=- /assembly_acc=CAM_ASM_000599
MEGGESTTASTPMQVDTSGHDEGGESRDKIAPALLRSATHRTPRSVGFRSALFEDGRKESISFPEEGEGQAEAEISTPVRRNRLRSERTSGAVVKCWEILSRTKPGLRSDKDVDDLLEIFSKVHSFHQVPLKVRRELCNQLESVRLPEESSMQRVGEAILAGSPSVASKEDMAEAFQRELQRQRSLSQFNAGGGSEGGAVSEEEEGEEGRNEEADFFCMVLKGKVEVRKTRKTELRQSILSQSPMDLLRSRGMTEGSLKRAKMGKLVTTMGVLDYCGIEDLLTRDGDMPINPPPASKPVTPEGSESELNRPPASLDIDKRFFHRTLVAVNDSKLAVLRRSAYIRVIGSHTSISNFAYPKDCREILEKAGNERTEEEQRRLESVILAHSKGKNSFFQSLPNEMSLQICKAMTIRELEPEEIVFRQGSDGKALYIILSGSVSIHRMSKNELVQATSAEKSTRFAQHGDTEVDFACHPILSVYGPCLAVLGPSDIFGELALTQGGHRQATVIARERTFLISIVSDDYNKILKKMTENEQRRNLSYLSSVAIFRHWEKSDLLSLSYAMKKVSFSPKQVVIEQGSHSCDTMYFITDG